jgi:GT2 family glycosyltransferase
VEPLTSPAVGDATAGGARVSVLIANVNGLPSIEECLRHLEALRVPDGVEVEVVVASAAPDDSASHIRSRFPDVILIESTERRGIPELRATALERSTGDYIAVTEDHCMVPPDWIEQILDGHGRGYDVVGGPVENGETGRLRDWAAYLTEYADLMPPYAGGEVSGVAGNNVSYARHLFDSVDPETLRTSWEYFIQGEMRAAGARFLGVPGMIVSHRKAFDFGYFLRQRYHYSRSWAGMRARRLSSAARLAYAAASPLLAPLVLYRIARGVLGKRRRTMTFVASLPMLAAFTASYAVGEGVGYLFGEGRSVLEVE